jgi:hypothetical protein
MMDAPAACISPRGQPQPKTDEQEATEETENRIGKLAKPGNLCRATGGQAFEETDD